MRSSELHISDYKLRSARAPEIPLSRSAVSKTTFAEIAERFASEPQREENDEACLSVPTATSAPAAGMRRPGLPLKAVIAAVIGGALVPTTILFALLWQGTMQTQATMPCWWSERGNRAQLERLGAEFNRARDRALLSAEDRGQGRGANRFSPRHRCDRETSLS